MHNALEIRLGLTVAVIDPNGRDVSPSGQKDRALLVLLALAPEHRRRRIWLQEKLWSDRFEEQRRTSLRKSLSNIRKALGAYRDALDADNFVVSLRNVKVVREELDWSVSEFLEELDVRDPEFVAWLQDVRGAQNAPKPEAMPTPPIFGAPPPLVRIACVSEPNERDRVFLENLVADMIAERLHSTGPVRIEKPRAPSENPKEDCDVLLEIDGHMHGSHWMLVVRLYSGSRRYFLWSGRFDSQVGISKLWSSAELPAFVNTVVANTFTKMHADLRVSTLFQLNYAVRQLYTGRIADLNAASETLNELASVQAEGADVALAWKGFEYVTRVLEHGDSYETCTDNAMLFAQRAVETSDANPTVLALAALVEMKLGNDPERALVLGQKALDLSETNPYALNAVAHTLSFLSRPHESYRLSRQAVEAGRNMPNDFTWDMQMCLAALSTGRHEEALDSATRSHFKMPNYRPALRYMVALQAMKAVEQAEKHLPATLAKLKRIEPGFEISHFAQEGYPMHTFRQLGLASELPV